MTFPKGGSEYGGYPGLIQPEPHKWEEDASEQLMLVFQTDEGDEKSSPETVAEAHRADGKKRL